MIIEINKEGFGFWQTVIQVWYYRPDYGMIMPLCEVVDIPFGAKLTAIVDANGKRFIYLELNK